MNSLANVPPLVKYNLQYKQKLHYLINDGIKNKAEFKILDIGCKRGADLEELSFIDKEKSLYGIDIAFEPLEGVLKRLNFIKNLFVIQAEAECLPFGDNSFDIVIASEVIEHIENVAAVMREARRVLNPGGLFIITTPSKYNYTRLIGKLLPSSARKRMRKLVYHINPGRDVNPHVREYTPEELKKIVENNGFRVEAFMSGVLRVPVWTLFDRFYPLLIIWTAIDKFFDKFSLGRHLKFNFVMSARKT